MLEMKRSCELYVGSRKGDHAGGRANDSPWSGSRRLDSAAPALVFAAMQSAVNNLRRRVRGGQSFPGFAAMPAANRLG
jgi:hypothetical protein